LQQAGLVTVARAATPPTVARIGGGTAASPNAALTITQPVADSALPAGNLIVSADYTGPNLVPAASAIELNQYHLHYFLEVEPERLASLGQCSALKSRCEQRRQSWYFESASYGNLQTAVHTSAW
jgi:hypothetical protein